MLGFDTAGWHEINYFYGQDYSRVIRKLRLFYWVLEFLHNNSGCSNNTTAVVEDWYSWGNTIFENVVSKEKQVLVYAC